MPLPKARPCRARAAAFLRARWLPVLFVAMVGAVLVPLERDAATLPFTLAVGGVLASATYAASRRRLVSLVTAAGLLTLSAAGSIAKFKWMTINAHVFDLWFYVANPETIAFMAGAFPKQFSAAAAAAVLLGLTILLGWRLEKPRDGSRRFALLALSAGLVALPVTLPRSAADFNYHIEDRHFASSFFASVTDLARFGEPSPLKPAAAPPTVPFAARQTCVAPSATPDIVLTLSESAVPPAIVPGWKYDSSLMETFKSFDGRVHAARVETHAGGTWISHASVVTGLSMADFGWKRPYAPLLLKGDLRHGLAAALAQCGYRTVVFSPQWYRFVNEGPFLTSVGFTDYLDARALGARPHEADAFYFNKALDFIRRHRAEDGRPLFLFVMTMAAHSPYDSRQAPARLAPGEPFGNDAATDEYLRRLTFAQQDYAGFLAGLRALQKPVVAAQFGDHQPVVTHAAFEPTGESLGNWRSRYYETFYGVQPLHFTPQAALPDVPQLDLAYLGVTLMEFAGLPLDPAFADKRALRDRCRGAFHTCSDRAAVDRHLERMRLSGLLGTR